MFKIEGLNKREYGKTLVSDFNIELESGELLVILGDDKSGRKDILDMISGFKKPNNGQIFIGGEPVLGNVLKARRSIGYSAVLDVYANFSVKSFIKLMTKVRNIKEDEVEEEVNRILDLVKFAEDPDLKIKELDEVEEKKLSIASAFIGSPEVILLDDPFSNTEKEESKEKLAKTIEMLKADNIIIVATNDKVIESMADRVIVLTHKGQVEIDLDELKKKNKSIKEKQKEILNENNIKGKHYDR